MKLYAHDPRFVFNGRDGSFPDSVVVREIWCENVYEVYDGDLSDTGIIVDIGANIGAFTLFGASLGASKVIAVEPERGNLNLLKQNIAQNKEHTPDCEFVVDEHAIGGKAGSAFITDEHGDSKVIVDTDKDMQPVRVITLDDLWRKHRLEYVDVLKIDIEGFEGQVLLNASERTMNFCRYITVEYDQHSDDLGALVEKISKTHQIKYVGAHGGMLYGKRY